MLYNSAVYQPETDYVYAKNIHVRELVGGHVRLSVDYFRARSSFNWEIEVGKDVAAELSKALARAAGIDLSDLAPETATSTEDACGDPECESCYPPTAPAADAKGWEPVTPVDPEDEECNGDVDRMRVPGGWIYTICHAPGDGQSAVFVPDPK